MQIDGYSLELLRILFDETINELAVGGWGPKDLEDLNEIQAVLQAFLKKRRQAVPDNSK
jgi:hypothetical protein